MANADKRIPATEERRQQLHDLKDAGETYDELIGGLIEEHKKRRLMADMWEKREEGEFVPLEEADQDEE